MRPRISVLLPVFNGRGFLREAIDSVACQTLPPSELIIVDDGSTDGSLELLEGFRPGFPVRVLRQVNAGQSAARNRAAAMAAGDLLAFLDQDDVWYPAHLEALAVPLSADPSAGWSYSDFDEIDSDGHLVTRRFLREYAVGNPKSSVVECLASDLMVLPSASLLRRTAFAAVAGFDERLSGYEDDDLFVRIFRSGWGHAFLDRSLVKFRIHPVSSSSTQRFFESRIRFAAKLASLFPDDSRMRRYYLRDLIAPRFFQTSLDDYVRACAQRDWDQARFALGVLNHFARLRQAGLWLHCKMLCIQEPRLFRMLVMVNDHLPARARLVHNPGVTLH
jgi:glycosyltransferase involved in cell wall biosynthesis